MTVDALDIPEIKSGMEYTWSLADDAGEGNENDGPRLRHPQGRNDFVGGIDNEALDFSQLEDFINNEDEGENTYFVDTLGRNESGRGAGGPTIVVVEAAEEAASRLTAIPSTFTLSHNLPESPPDSGSEPPYSPQQDGDKNLSHSKHAGNHLSTPEILLQASHPSLYTNPHLSLKSPNVHPVQSAHLHETMLMQHPVLTPLLSANSSSIMNSGQRSDAILLSRNETAAILEMSNEARSPLLNRVLNTSIGSPALIHSPPSGSLLNNASQPESPPNSVVQNISASFDSNDGDSGITTIFSSIHPSSKKRKLSDDVGGPVLYVKQEKLESNLDLSPESNSSHAVLGEDGYELDGVCIDANFQCIRFQPFQQTQWHVLCDQNLKELPVPHYRVDADKGFNFSNADDAFVCQKKNHFQITCHTQLLGDAQFIKTPEGVKKISSFYLHFYGVKVESPTQIIKVEQSQSDRSKKPFHPVLVELQGEQVTKVTVGRLHFSETTSNNMRKKGKPNPDQRYFYLVVGLHAHTNDNNYQVVAHASERIIVRASNPGQFESDVELCWQKGHSPDSIFHAGRVGINTDRPDECLVVHGNLKVTGHIVQPSDLRAKLHLQECDTKNQLKNIEKLRVVKYRYAEEFAERLGITEDTGVIAQEVQTILPDAVRPGGDISLASGEVIQNFLVVNKDRIFMENVGAVKELCKVTDHLGKRIEEVEKMNRRLAKLKKMDSFRSISSSSTVSSKLAASDKTTYKPRLRKDSVTSSSSASSWVCSNRAIHGAIGVLVVIMALCLAAMATLYFLQIQEHNRQRLRNEQNVWRPPPLPPRQNTAIRSQPQKRPWSLTSTISNLLDKNKTATVLSDTINNLLDANRTTSVITNTINKTATTLSNFLSKGDINKSTRLLPLFHRPHSTDSTRMEGAQMDHSVPAVTPGPLVTVQRPPRPLGRPPHCSGVSNLYQEGDDVLCQTFCCGYERLVPTAAKLPLVQDVPYDVHDDEPSILTSTKNNEVESPPPAATNTIDHGLRSKQTKTQASEGLAIRHTRARRNADDLLEPDNSNFYPATVSDQNGVVVTLYGTYLNQTLTPEFCAHDVPEVTLCLDKAAHNYTYHVPISRYFPDDVLFVEFQFQKGRNRSEVHVCQESTAQVECSPARSPPELPTPRDPSVFFVELWHYASATIKYRVSLSHKVQMPDLGERILCSEKIFVPPSFPSIMKGYCKAAIRTQPYDLLRWSAAYFRALAKGENPPMKERLEFSTPIYPSGLTPGYLKALVNQLGKEPLTIVTAYTVESKWSALCLPPGGLDPLITLLGGPTFPWLRFLAVAAGSISTSLTQTMILICELLTEDPDGARAAIPVDIFLDLYQYLAYLDCGLNLTCTDQPSIEDRHGNSDVSNQFEETTEQYSGQTNEPTTHSKSSFRKEGEVEPIIEQLDVSRTGTKNKHLPGIGPRLPEKQVKAVVDFMQLWAGRQDGVVMPRNIRHWMCPPLDNSFLATQPTHDPAI